MTKDFLTCYSCSYYSSIDILSQLPKVQLPVNEFGLQDISFLFLKSIQAKKTLLRGHQEFFNYLGLKFSQFQP